MFGLPVCWEGDGAPGDRAGNSPSLVSRPNPKEKRIASRQATRGHRLGTAIVLVLSGAQSWLPSRWLQGVEGLMGPKGHRDAGFRGKGKGREGAERQRILHRDGRRQKRSNESHRHTDSDRLLEPETQCEPGDREMGTEMQTATGRLRLPGEKVIRGAEQKTAPEAWSTPRAGAEARGKGRGGQWGSRGARDSPGRVSPDPSGRARLPSASWPRCRGISQGGTQGPRPVPASPPQTQRIGLLGPLGSLGLSRQAKIFSLTTQGWTGLLGK